MDAWGRLGGLEEATKPNAVQSLQLGGLTICPDEAVANLTESRRTSTKLAADVKSLRQNVGELKEAQGVLCWRHAQSHCTRVSVKF